MVASPSLAGKHNNFAGRCVSAAVDLKSAFDDLASLYSEWVAEGYAAGNVGTEIVSGDLTSTNAYLTSENLNSLFVSQQNLVTWWAAGNGTNVSALIP